MQLEFEIPTDVFVYLLLPLSSKIPLSSNILTLSRFKSYMMRIQKNTLDASLALPSGILFYILCLVDGKQTQQKQIKFNHPSSTTLYSCFLS